MNKYNNRKFTVISLIYSVCSISILVDFVGQSLNFCSLIERSSTVKILPKNPDYSKEFQLLLVHFNNTNVKQLVANN